MSVEPIEQLEIGLDPSVSDEVIDTADRDREYLRSPSSPVPVDAPERVVRAVDLFSGCGGLSLGAREACHARGYGFEVALAIDSESRALEVYKDNFDPGRALDQDISEVLPGELGDPPTAEEQELASSLDEIDLLLAGPPCQGHSDLNNHTRREDPRNRLYEKVGRFAELVRPTHLIVENVPTVVHGRDGTLDRTVEHLTHLGYSVDSALIELWRLGVPQLRKRHVVVASLAHTVSIDACLRCHEQGKRSVRWAIDDLEEEWKTAKEPFCAASNATRTNRERMEYLLAHDLYDLPNDQRPECHRDGSHSYKSMYGRLKWDEPAQTITSGFLSPGQGRYIHPSQPRTLTPHEAARLQFFPDFFDFSSAQQRTALARMIGNAVPKKLSQILWMELIDNLSAQNLSLP